MRHSAGAWSGKTSEVPTFPVEALWETASRLRGQNRDAVSGRGIKTTIAVEEFLLGPVEA